ncbi:MAG TPA: PAS domain S-box protein [Steroidobacteraceae bacterium]|nr:PAS domain S-box protein [Steroidobacteraceae bacterium]
MQSQHRPAGTAVAPPLVDDVESSAAQRRLRQAAEACPDLLILVDRNLNVVFANRACDGRASQQLCGVPVSELLPAEYLERALQCLYGVLQVGAPDRFEFEMLGPRGTPRHIEVRVAPVREQQQIVALTLNGSDTTQHVLAQRAVATQAKMIESMLEGVALVNEAGLIVITNPAFDALFGYSRGMLIGRPLSTLSEAIDLSQMPRSGANGSAPWPLEFETRRPDGSTVSVAGAISHLDDAERRHGLLVLQDVGERKHLERALLDAVSREQDRIGNDLHDGLGQELTGIALMLRCLAGRLQSEHGKAPPEIESITRLLNNAVENTRSLARGLSPVHLERGGLRDALEGLAMHARNVYGIKASFTDKFPPTASLSAEVANHLYRIAQEAVTNAVKHGRATAVRLHLGAAHGKVRLTIADDGCGMTATQAERRSTDHVKGGMGLRIMRYRARIARGDVRIECGQPSGTRVICECPIDRAVDGMHGHQDRESIAKSHALSSEESRSRMSTVRNGHRMNKAHTTKLSRKTSRHATHAVSRPSKGKLKLRAKGART